MKTETCSYYTENLADFGFREIRMLRDILDLWVTNGLPDTFDNQGVRAAFNRNSGYVFLVNDDYQVAMVNGERLQVHHNTPYDGHEGFLSDLLTDLNPDDLHEDDVEYIIHAADQEGIDLCPPWLDTKIDKILEDEDESLDEADNQIYPQPEL